MIDQKELKEILRYCSETGNFYWIKSNSNRAKPGNKAGCPNLNGYIMIRINKKLYYAHRLAFMYIVGNMPKIIDHIDRNTSNNKWNNLREATRQENIRNTPARNKLGVKGVSKVRNKFYSTITVDRTSIKLGSFDNLYDADNAYKNAVKKYHTKNLENYFNICNYAMSFGV